MKDFYYILGTARDASPTEIDAAYQKLARKFLQGEGEQDEFMDAHFHEITEAYDVLRDVRRHSKYDEAVKRNQNRQLAVFKLKYLNIAVTLTFLVITGLFAGYVIRIINSHATKKVAPKPMVQSPIVLAHPKKHHISAMHVAKKPPVTTDTTAKQQPHAIPVAAQQASADSTYTTTLHANITGIVYLHQSPDYNSAILAKIPDKAEVRVLQKEPAYYK